MLELYQAEWCPYSHRVRQRLTELEIDFHARQVPAEREDRDELERATGTREIPVLVPDGGDPIADADAIVDYLDRRFDEGAQADAHRAKAESHG